MLLMGKSTIAIFNSYVKLPEGMLNSNGIFGQNLDREPGNVMIELLFYSSGIDGS